MAIQQEQQENSQIPLVVKNNSSFERRMGSHRESSNRVADYAANDEGGRAGFSGSDEQAQLQTILTS